MLNLLEEASQAYHEPRGNPSNRLIPTRNPQVQNVQKVDEPVRRPITMYEKVKGLIADPQVGFCFISFFRERGTDGGDDDL